MALGSFDPLDRIVSGSAIDFLTNEAVWEEDEKDSKRWSWFFLTKFNFLRGLVFLSAFISLEWSRNAFSFCEEFPVSVWYIFLRLMPILNEI